MLDLGFVRENPDDVRKNLTRRNDPSILKNFDELLSVDANWRSVKKSLDDKRHLRNSLTQRIQEAKIKKLPTDKLLQEAKKVPSEIKELEQKEATLLDTVTALAYRIPNLLHDSVPIGKDDSENQVVRVHGKTAPNPSLIHHGKFFESLDLVDFEMAGKVSGSGFYYLKGELALLDLALQRFAIDFLTRKGFTLIIPPFMLHRKPYEGVTDLHDFENVMYKIEGQDLYLIATSEHSLAVLHSNELLNEKNLPLLYVGISPCFRKEIGRHSVDERGLFRVHQFTKIEQFVFCKQEDSWKWHETLLQNAEELVKKLEIPNRVVNVCTGDIGAVAAKKYDIEAWSPREGKFVEIISCSNCTDFQANRLSIRYRSGQDKKTVHTLNSTAFATARLLRLIAEHYQTPKGALVIPKVLQPYMNGLKEIKPKTVPKK